MNAPCMYICDESKMSVAHYSVGRIAHNFFSFSCRLFWFAVSTLMVTLQQPKNWSEQRKIQPSHIIIIVKMKLYAMVIFLSRLCQLEMFMFDGIFMHHSNNRLYFGFLAKRNAYFHFAYFNVFEQNFS